MSRSYDLVLVDINKYEYNNLTLNINIKKRIYLINR